MLTLLSPALTVAMLGAIESLMSAVVADKLGGDRHNPNVELVAQGVANVVSPMVAACLRRGQSRELRRTFARELARRLPA